MNRINKSARILLAVATTVLLFEASGLTRNRVEASCGQIGSRTSSSANDALNSKGHYVSINGLNLYFAAHGAPPVPQPGISSTDNTLFAEILPALLRTRQVISIEQQGQNLSSDSDDALPLLVRVRIGNADVFGYRFGGITGLGIAISHPDLPQLGLVGKMTVIGANYISMDTHSEEPSSGRR